MGNDWNELENLNLSINLKLGTNLAVLTTIKVAKRRFVSVHAKTSSATDSNINN